MVLLGPAMCIVPLWFLTRPAVTTYFTTTDEAVPLPVRSQGVSPPRDETAGRSARALGRRVLSVALIVIGAYLVLTFGAVLVVMTVTAMSTSLHGVGPGSVPGLIVTAIFLGLTAGASALLVGGIALWGWDRRRMVFGVVLAAVGGFAGFTALTVALMRFSPEFVAIIEAQGDLRSTDGWETLATYITAVGLVVCAICVASGTLLIRRQMKADKREIQAGPEPAV
jgi:MFS family permease